MDRIEIPQRSSAAYLAVKRGNVRKTARVSLYIASRVGGSKRFQPPVQRIGDVIAIPVLGRLLHHCARI
jgi:hypothetical protein